MIKDKEKLNFTNNINISNYFNINHIEEQYHNNLEIIKTNF